MKRSHNQISNYAQNNNLDKKQKLDVVRSTNLASELSNKEGESNEEILGGLPKKFSELKQNSSDFQVVQRCNEYLFGNRNKYHHQKFTQDDARLLEFKGAWFSSKTVLDIGCGDG